MKQFDSEDKRLRASGTSDGARTGHAQRKTDKANAASQEAHEASSKAHDSDDEDDHRTAMEAHQDAHDAHESAHEAHVKAGSDDDTKDHHKNAMAAHKAQADYHAGKSGDDDDDDDVKGVEPLHCRDCGVPITASGKQWKKGELARFQWMPAGVSTITATYARRPITVTIECDEKGAKSVQASFAHHIKASPRRRPFGCVEHREEEAAFTPKAFEWSDEPEPGIYCSADPTSLGERNVNGGIHSSFSPSFTSDAAYDKAECEDCGNTVKACKCGGHLVFPEGVRGSESNPARVTGVSPKSVGSLTNWQAFKSILPILASEPNDRMEPLYANEEVILAGDYPGHPFHGNQYADGGGEGEHNQASSKAHELSKNAKTASQHRSAAAAHRRAAKLQEEEGHDATADYHRAMAHFHDKAASKGGTMKAVGLIEDDLLLRATQANSRGLNQPNADQLRGYRMKVKFINARGNHAAGSYGELDGQDLLRALEAGDVLNERDARAIEARDAEMNTFRAEQKTRNLGIIDAALERGVKRGAIVAKGTDDKSKDTVRAAMVKRLESGTDAQFIADFIDHMPGKVDMGLLEGRVTSGNGNGHVWAGESTAQEVCMAVLTAKEEEHKMLGRDGATSETIKAAGESSRKTSQLLKQYVQKEFDARGDFAIRDMIRATISDVTDPNTQVGTLSSTLILMRNLGYLKNKLGFVPYITTDLRAEPAVFGQQILTRIITPPNVLTYVPGVGYTSDTTTINNYIASLGTNKALIGPVAAALGSTQTSGTQTLSAPSTTDVQVQINNHVAVELTFPTSTLGATSRNLFAEQQGAQLYSLAELITKVFLATAFSATWTAAAGATRSLGNQFGLPGIVGIKTQMTLSKIPDLGRFVVLHSLYHDLILQDSNLLTTKAILALINKNESAFQMGELPELFGVKPLESQLAAYNSAGQTVASSMLGLTTLTSLSNVSGVTAVGIAGNSASLLFVERIPQDYTTVFKDVPATAAIEIVTEPESGISMLFSKYVNHQLAQVFARAACMFGFATGDLRQGFILTP